MVRLVRLGALSALVSGVVALIAAGCGPVPVGRLDSGACSGLDSLYAEGFPRPLSISGHATVDADQYKVRGQIQLDARAPGEVVLEFTSAVLFGQAREDVVFSSVDDTLRIVDRERGAYYEGVDAESFLARSLDTDLDVRRVLVLVFGGCPPCAELSDVRLTPRSSGSMVCTGTCDGDRFRVVFDEGRRLEEIDWPVRYRLHGSDRLRVSYEWEPGAAGEKTLRALTVSFEKREWRCKIKSTG